MQYNKTFKTYSEQLQILIDRGLLVKDEEKAKQYLKKFNYYRFSGYCIPFQDIKDRFNNNTHFSDILKLCDFDSQLRTFLYDVLEKIEIQLRALMAYYFGQKYGPWGYIDFLNFSLDFKYYEWITKIKDEIDRSNEIFIKHYKDTYTDNQDLPIWMVTEIMSLGGLSNMFSGMKAPDQKDLSSEFGVKRPVVKSWLHHLTYIRNMCAHHCRIWNRSWAIKPLVPDERSWSFLTDRENKLFVTFSMLNFLTNKFSLSINIPEELENIISKFDVSFPFSLKEKMGFPDNYNEIELWKK